FEPPTPREPIVTSSPEQMTRSTRSGLRRGLLSSLVLGCAAALLGCQAGVRAATPQTKESAMQQTKESAMQLTQECEKTFPRSEKVEHQKVTFKNRYGITLAADLYQPKSRAGLRLAAIAVSGPFGAVKEQSSGLYAQTMAERGFVTLA